MINGIPFTLYKIFEKKENAEKLAKEMKDKGWNVRVFKSSKGFEVWVSKNPRWFYELFEVKT